MSKSYRSRDLDRFEHRRKAAVKRARRQERDVRRDRKSGKWAMASEAFTTS